MDAVQGYSPVALSQAHGEFPTGPKGEKPEEALRKHSKRERELRENIAREKPQARELQGKHTHKIKEMTK